MARIAAESKVQVFSPQIDVVVAREGGAP